MNKSQRVLQMTEALGTPSRLTIRATGAVGRALGGRHDAPKFDMRLRDLWVARNAADKLAKGRWSAKKASFDKQIAQIKRSKSFEKGQVASKRKETIDALAAAHREGKLKKQLGLQPTGKISAADQDRLRKKAGYAAHGLPSGMSKARQLAAASHTGHSDVRYDDDVVDAEWYNMDTGRSSAGYKQPLALGSGRGRGRPKGSGKNPTRVRVKPPGSGPGRPRKDVSPADFDSQSIRIGGRTIARPVALIPQRAASLQRVKGKMSKMSKRRK